MDAVSCHLLVTHFTLTLQFNYKFFSELETMCSEWISHEKTGVVRDGGGKNERNDI